MLEVVKLSNPLGEDFIHNFAGKKFRVKAGAVVDLPYDVARDTAYHLAQKVCHERGLPLFGIEHDAVIDELMGVTKSVEEVEDSQEEEILDTNDLLSSEEEVPNTEEIVELTPSGSINDAFVPETPETKAPKAKTKAPKAK